MRPFQIMRLRNNVSGGGGDTQTVTTGAAGLAPDRRRGFIVSDIGSIVDGSSNLYGGLAIEELCYLEAEGYVLNIPGATNSGWTQLVIDGSKTLLRSSATFGLGRWVWATADTITTQAFGANGTSHTCVFS